jgi:2,3-dihydroxy-2,3-dihydrophenylpropionate dehydrogenase
MGRLDDTSVLVTGGGSGLGRAIVSRFVEEGARVVVLDRSKEKLDEVAGAFGDAVRTVAGDVTSVEDNEAAVAAAVNDFGGLDVLVGNAGIWDFNASLEATDARRLAGGFDELFGVNVKGYLLAAKAALPALRAARGSMVFTLSNAAFYPGGRRPALHRVQARRCRARPPAGLRTGPARPGQRRGPRRNGDRPPRPGLPRAGRAVHHRGDADPGHRARARYLLLASRRESATVTGTVVDISGMGTPPRRRMTAGGEA